MGKGTRHVGQLALLCLLGLIFAGLTGQIWAGQAVADGETAKTAASAEADLPVTADVEEPDENEQEDMPLTVEVELDPKALEGIRAQGEGPQVMIYHTHSHEAYVKGDQDYKGDGPMAYRQPKLQYCAGRHGAGQPAGEAVWNIGAAR